MAQQRHPGPKGAILVVISGGGFTFETKRLLSDFDSGSSFVFLRTEFGGVPGQGGLPAGDGILVPSFATKTQKSVWRSIAAFMRTFVATVRVVRSRPVAAVVCVGCSYAVPVFLAGKLLRRRTIFVESVTRVSRLSVTGRIVYHLRLYDIFIVQWPSLHEAYTQSRLGTIL